MSPQPSRPDDEHPDDDLLADLGAGLLEGEAAHAVEEHVVGCAACLELLEQSEALVRGLNRLPAEPMPDDVRARLDQVLATSGSAGGVAAAAVDGAEKRPTDTGPVRVLKPLTGDRLSRLARPSTGARRVQLDEERDEDRGFRLLKYGRWAAAAVLVVGVGLGATAGLRALTSGNGSDAGAATSAGSAAAGGVVTAVLATGTNYDKAGLAKQVDQLVSTSRARSTVKAQDEGASPEATGPQATGPQAASTPGSASSVASGSASGSAPTGGLADNQTLANCLTAIGRGGEHPLVVDLARYQDREAAVIVLQQPDGTYEVWVVARTCAPGADGTIAAQTVKP